MTPAQEHAASMAEYLATVGGGKPGNGATLSLQLAPAPVVVDCTHTKIDAGFKFMFGKSDTTTVERCEFLASAVPASQWPNVTTGLKCTLTLYPGGPSYLMRLDAGGQVEGGLVFRFMLIGQDYKG